MGLLVGLCAFLLVYNNATNLLGLPGSWYVPLNVTLAVALVALARVAGHSWGSLGLDPPALAGGLRWGGLVAVAVACCLAVALAVPALRPLLADQRVAGLGVAGVAYHALVRIPLGTALFEEVAFRGVLLGVWTHHHGLVAATVGSSVVFGLWHIGPTIAALDVNQAATEPAARALAVAGAVVVTAAAGALFSLLRVASGGILAPVLAHWATNGLAVVAAHAAHGR